MKLDRASAQRGDVGFLDVLALVGAVIVVAAIALPMIAKSRAKACTINCVNNVKQIGLSFRLWAGDNEDKYPMQVSTNLGGTMELVRSGPVAAHFNVMSNELSTPKILLCPKDDERFQTVHFGHGLQDTNISFFVVPEADETLPQMWLTGDRNLVSSGLPLRPGLFWLPPNRVISWTSQMHSNSGNLCFTDGSVRQLFSAQLQPSATNALRAYYEATTNKSFRLAIP